jgi:small basic protein
MWMISVAAGLVGFAMIYFSKVTIPPDYGAYVSIAALAGLDAVIGGFRAAQENKFQSKVFISGFLVGVFLAIALTWFGERIGVEISLAAVFVFVWRIMQNLSIIRRVALAEDRFHMPHMPHMPHLPTRIHRVANPVAQPDETHV